MINLISSSGSVVINVVNITHVTFAENYCTVHFEKGNIISLKYEDNPELDNIEDAVRFFENLK